MDSIVERVKNLALPEGQYVVIGSGLLDALGYRTAADLDLVVSAELFEVLRAQPMYSEQQRSGGVVLVDAVGTFEAWHDWKDDMPFEVLIGRSIQMDGVTFAHPEDIITRKLERNTEKDQQDIKYLKEYLHNAS